MLWLATILFFLPSVLLGTITPMIVKLSLSSLDETGRVVGRIQAAASLGSIVGVFLTGFLLDLDLRHARDRRPTSAVALLAPGGREQSALGAELAASETARRTIVARRLLP